MKANVGGLDRVLRVVVGLGLLAMAIAGIGTPMAWIGVVPLATGLMKFCPFYTILGLNSCPAK